MTQIVDNKLQGYLELVDRFFYRDPVELSAFEEEDTLKYLKTDYKEVFLQTRSYDSKWNDLIDAISGVKGIYPSVRDMSHNLTQGFRSIIHLQSENDLDGIVLCLSVIGQKIGFYYADNTFAAGALKRTGNRIKENSRPIVTPVVHTIADRHAPSVNSGVSYSPMNDLHLKFRPMLLDLIVQFFPGFTEFDNKYADYKLDGVQIERGFFNKLDLFQAFFGTDTDGVI